MNYQELLPILVSYDSYKSSDAVILLEGDGFSRIDKACEIVNNQQANYLIFSGGIDNQSVGSFDYNKCQSFINKKSIPHEKLILELNSKNTREQAKEVVELCKKFKWKSIILTASHYHQLRAFLTFLKVLIEEKLENELIIYNAPEKKLEWFEDTGWGKRIELLENEFNKIITYQSLNHIASYKEAIEYLEWRENYTKN
jgi:uncharacterized SAM-binding protein YcdF (DUF218 family)